MKIQTDMLHSAIYNVNVFHSAGHFNINDINDKEARCELV